MQPAQPNKIDAYAEWDGGISDYDKNADNNEYAFGRSINYRDNPRKLTLLPKTTKESGSVVLGLPKDGDRVGTDVWYYDDGGRIYKRTSTGSHTLQRTVSSSHGNGMKYYTEDDFLYYTSDKVIGRYGQISGTPSFVDDFLGSEGGIPQNTYWVDFEASSSQYASRADTASLSITGDLAMECTIKPESLPTVGNSMVLGSKWDINSNKRSYKFELYAVSAVFGDGSNSTLTISVDTTDAPIDSACTGTVSTTSLTATNASFAAGQAILIIQSQGSGAGTYQRNKISSYVAGTITLETALNTTYTTGAQVLVLKQYTSVTVNSGVTWSAKAWNGTVGGILAFLCNGTTTITGNISATGKGFRGGANSNGGTAFQGEGETGNGTATYSTNGSGAQPGKDGSGGGLAGVAYMTDASLATRFVFGGGGSGAALNGSSGGTGGTGGGSIFITSATTTVAGTIVSAGSAGTVRACGGGAGGSILLNSQTATLGTLLVTAPGGAGVTGSSGDDGGAGGAGSVNGSNSNGQDGGAGAVGRVHLNYYTSYTGTSTPTLDVTQDNSLVTTTTYQLRLGLSSNGTNEEFLTKAIAISAAQTTHVAVSWDASASTATFVQDGVSLGTSTGAFTSLNDNASVFGIAADFNSTARNFYDGRMDEFRLWNTERTAAQFLANKEIQIAATTPGLVAYYKFNNDYADATANANDLTASNSPVFFTDVAFSSPTSRQDLDQSLDTSGNTYTTPTAINEGATHRQTFIPNRDPQKSVEVLVAGKGTGDWTLTVHDVLNKIVATATITNANMAAGDKEFVFSSVWRPIRGASYHFHITSTVADGTVTTTTSADLETVDFHTYYQFLVTDTDFHPIEQYLNFLAIGNGRYVATYGADTGYNPHRIVLPSDWKVRGFAIWRGLLAIACWKGTNIYDTDQGMIFLWDGYSPTYLDAIPIPEGGINAIFSSRGVLYVWAGYHGDLLAYRGGDYAEFVKRVPKMTSAEYIETLPKAVGMWDGLLRWGVAGSSNSSAVERGVYTFGHRKASNPESLSYDFPLSTGSRASTGVKVGFVFAIDRKLLIGWKDGATYGMDVVDPAGDCFATGTVEKDIKDYGGVWKEKKALTVRADFKTLAAGQSIKVKYRLNRDSTWVESDPIVSTSDDPTVVRLPIDLGNNREVEIAADIATTSGVSPTFLELTLESNLKKGERIV